jgi:hypothetical protein
MEKKGLSKTTIVILVILSVIVFFVLILAAVAITGIYINKMTHKSVDNSNQCSTLRDLALDVKPVACLIDQTDKTVSVSYRRGSIAGNIVKVKLILTRSNGERYIEEVLGAPKVSEEYTQKVTGFSEPASVSVASVVMDDSGQICPLVEMQQPIACA